MSKSLACASRISKTLALDSTLKISSDYENIDTGTIPMHIRNAPVEAMKSSGYGVGYKYPHEYPHHQVEQQYLPDKIKDKKYYIKDDTEEF